MRKNSGLYLLASRRWWLDRDNLLDTGMPRPEPGDNFIYSSRLKNLLLSFLHLQNYTPTTCITDDKLKLINAELAFASSADGGNTLLGTGL